MRLDFWNNIVLDQSWYIIDGNLARIGRPNKLFPVGIRISGIGGVHLTYIDIETSITTVKSNGQV